jgi:hypothetical protein
MLVLPNTIAVPDTLLEVSLVDAAVFPEVLTIAVSHTVHVFACIW